MTAPQHVTLEHIAMQEAIAEVMAAQKGEA